MIRGNRLFLVFLSVIITVGLIWVNRKNPIDGKDRETETGESVEKEDSTESVKKAEKSEKANETKENSVKKKNAVSERKAVSNKKSSAKEKTAKQTKKSTKKNKTKKIKGSSVLQLLSESKVNSTSGYEEHYGEETVSVFAKERHNTFGFQTAVSYNLWNGNVQSAVFSTEQMCKHGSTLSFSVGLETGGSGKVILNIYNGDSEKPVKSITLNADSEPQHISIQLDKKVSSLRFEVDNQSSKTNRVVFYNLAIK